MKTEDTKYITTELFGRKSNVNTAKVLVNGDEVEVNVINPNGELVLTEGGEALFAYRLLSNTIVANNTRRATDFTTVDMKGAVHKAVGVSYFTDHKPDADNVRGRVMAAWVADTNPINKFPAGLNGIIAVTDLELAQNIKKGNLVAGSVEVGFTWKKSHDLPDNEFNENVGRKAKDGSTIRRIVEEITGFGEFSALRRGADPNAQVLDADGTGYLTNLRASFGTDKFSEVFNDYANLEVLGIAVADEVAKFELEGEYKPEPSGREKLLLDAFEERKTELTKLSKTLQAFHAKGQLTSIGVEHFTYEKPYSIQALAELTAQIQECSLLLYGGMGATYHVPTANKEVETKKETVEEVIYLAADNPNEKSKLTSLFGQIAFNCKL